jgi:hypothetical protein
MTPPDRIDPESEPRRPDEAGGDPAPTRSSTARATTLALLVIAVGLAWTFRDFVRADMSDVTRFVLHESRAAQGTGSFAARVDTRFVVWLVSRNAHTFASQPWRAFDGEICHPTPQSIALGEPGFALGLVGVPAWLATHDPILTFNVVSVAIVAIAAFAMFALARAWTGSVTAGLVAALAYGFHPLKVGDPIHLYVPDTGWTVLALLFFVRFLERGRWKDVAALALAIGMQIGGSLYPLIAAAAIGLPVAVWGVVRMGVARTRPTQWLALVGVVGLCVAFVYAPFLGKAASGELATRPAQVFVPWSQLFGLGPRSLGWGLIALAALAFLPRRRSSARPLPRAALLVGLGLCLALATGGNEVARLAARASGEPVPPALPNLFEALSSLLPGLTVVRLPAAIGHGAIVVLGLLAGLGVAAAMDRVRERAQTRVGVIVVALVFVMTLRPGLPGSAPIATWSQRPSDARLAFFDELAARHDAGPLLELPNPPRPHPRYGRSILLAAYHHRRTSSCYNSFLPSETLEAEANARRIPSAEALRAAAGMGFTTLLVHRDVPGGPALEARLLDSPGVRLVHRDDAAGLAAFELLDPR